MNGKIKVKCIQRNTYGFAVGEMYDAFIVKSAFKGKNDVLCVVNKYGDEYACPANLFERVSQE